MFLQVLRSNAVLGSADYCDGEFEVCTIFPGKGLRCFPKRWWGLLPHSH